MGLKEDLMAHLEKETAQFTFENPSEKLTANVISNIFQVKRNTVSHYLNQLFDENLIIKINTRPVYFLNRPIFEQKYYSIPTTLFNSFQELQDLQPSKQESKDIFDQLIGSDGSLKKGGQSN